MKKVAIFLTNLREYRIPIYNGLCSNYHITVFCSNYIDNYNGDILFDIHYISQDSLGPFIFHSRYDSLNNFDVVICQFNLRCIDLLILPLLPWVKPKVKEAG